MANKLANQLANQLIKDASNLMVNQGIDLGTGKVESVDKNSKVYLDTLANYTTDKTGITYSVVYGLSHWDYSDDKELCAVIAPTDLGIVDFNIYFKDIDLHTNPLKFTALDKDGNNKFNDDCVVLLDMDLNVDSVGIYLALSCVKNGLGVLPKLLDDLDVSKLIVNN